MPRAPWVLGMQWSSSRLADTASRGTWGMPEQELPGTARYRPVLAGTGRGPERHAQARGEIDDEADRAAN